MHFEILVEGQTELTVLSILMNKILGEYNQPHTWKIHKHQGVGRLPDDFSEEPNPKDRTLLHNLPSKLRAYGNSMGDNEAVVLLIDLDDREDCIEFKAEINTILDFCEQKPIFLIRIAIEELESWYFGDRNAIIQAFINYNENVFESYIQDSQCGTWEKLAEIIHPGGINTLESFGRRSVRILEEKRKWAVAIAPNMNVEENNSPSFCCFRDGLRRLAGI